MYRLRSKSGDESVFRTPEEIRSALLSGIATPDAQIWDSDLKGWVPLLEHALYKQIAAAPADRKSGASRVSGATSPPTPKPTPKLVIKRPGDAGTKVTPAVKPPVVPPKAAAPPAPPAPPAGPAPPKGASPLDDLPELDLVDLDLSLDAPAASPPPAPKAPAPAPAAPPPPPTRATPAPQPSIAEAPTRRISSPRVSGPSAPSLDGLPTPMRHTAEAVAQGGSKKGLVIAVIVIVAIGGGAFAMLGGKGQEATLVDTAAIAAPSVDSTPADTNAAPADSAARPDTTRATDTATVATPVAAATTLTGTPAADTAAAVSDGETVPFAPIVERGPVPWTAVVLPPPPAIGGGVEGVRARYLAAQARALATYEAGLEVAGFQRMFDPARLGRADRRDASLEAVDGARSALRDFRRRQASIDFAYSDTLRQAGADDPSIRSLGPALRETPAQLALTDSILGAVGEMYGILITESGGYTATGGQIRWRDADNAARYRVLQERLTAQYGRLRSRSPADIPPAMLGILRGIGLPR